jgi:hypothetical protein
VTEEEDFAESMLLLDSSTALEEEFVMATLLLDPSLSLEDEFNESALLLDSSTTLEEEFAVAMLLLDTSLSLGVTGEELPSSSQATRNSRQAIAAVVTNTLANFFRTI